MRVKLGKYRTRRWYHRFFKLETPEPTRKVKIDYYDTWGMDHTLSLIIHPMLIQLRDTTHGYPAQLAENDSGEEDDSGFERWKEILNKMIWSFEQAAKDDYGDEEFFSDCSDEEYAKRKAEADKEDTVKGMTKWVSKLDMDKEGLVAHHEKIQEGFDLFGKYYMNLWD